MGPIVRLSEEGVPLFDRILLRPFKTSTTFVNLDRERCGVFHVTDDVLLIARAAVVEGFDLPPVVPAIKVRSVGLADFCRAYEFVVDSVDASGDRSEVEARVVHKRYGRDFAGLNRAKHAVVEAAILATRRHLIDERTLRPDLDRLRPLVQKTGGPAEHEAFDLIETLIPAARTQEGSG